MTADYTTTFTAVADFSDAASNSQFTPARSDRATRHRLVGREGDQPSAFDLLLPLVLILDPAAGLRGRAAGGTRPSPTAAGSSTCRRQLPDGTPPGQSRRPSAGRSRSPRPAGSGSQFTTGRGRHRPATAAAGVRQHARSSPPPPASPTRTAPAPRPGRDRRRRSSCTAAPTGMTVDRAHRPRHLGAHVAQPGRRPGRAAGLRRPRRPRHAGVPHRRRRRQPRPGLRHPAPHDQPGRKARCWCCRSRPPTRTATRSRSGPTICPRAAVFDPAARRLVWTPDYAAAGTYRTSSSTSATASPRPARPSPCWSPRARRRRRWPPCRPDAPRGRGRPLQPGRPAGPTATPVTYSSDTLPAGATLDPNTGAVRAGRRTTTSAARTSSRSRPRATACPRASRRRSRCSTPTPPRCSRRCKGSSSPRASRSRSPRDPNNPGSSCRTVFRGTSALSTITVLTPSAGLPAGAAFDPATDVHLDAGLPGRRPVRRHVHGHRRRRRHRHAAGHDRDRADHRAQREPPAGHHAAAEHDRRRAARSLNMTVRVADADGNPLVLSAAAPSPASRCRGSSRSPTTATAPASSTSRRGTGDRGDYTRNAHRHRRRRRRRRRPRS